MVVVFIASAGMWWFLGTRLGVPVTTFEECVAAGNPVMESYPRQCRAGEETFIESIGNELEKTDLIRIDTPRPNQTISSPLTITGEARGNWFFEASFPVVLTDWDGKIIAQGIAQAKGEWMTTDFVPFEATLTFAVDTNAYSDKGSLILRKDNPSGLPQYDDALEIPVVLAPSTGTGGVGFAEYLSGIRGTVVLGPTCPVMRNPPDPQCADKPYQTSISIFRAGDLTSATVQAFASAESAADGTFQVSLPPGDYVLGAVGGKVMPRCAQVPATVPATGYTEVTISCDTGIR